METRPEQPPEGRLIADAADRMNLSLRKAADRAGISYGRWRQIVTGCQNVSPGSFAAVHAPAKTLAKMAAVVGVTPAQLAEAGREDAAEALARLQSPEAAAPELAEPGDDSPPDAVKGAAILIFRRAFRGDEAELRAEIREAKSRYRNVPLSQVPESGTEPHGASFVPGEAFPAFDAIERSLWGLVTFSEEDRLGLILGHRANRQFPTRVASTG